jgi:dTDP-glucose pyrophosphorylase
MYDLRKHLVKTGSALKEVLIILDELAEEAAILFIVDENDILLGSLTDGDIRRGLIKGLNLNQNVDVFSEHFPKYITKEKYKINDIIELRNQDLGVIPVLDKDNKVLNVINFKYVQSYLPIDTVIMAGGKGSRLRPLTNDVPKPLLKVGELPILEHNLNRLRKFGVDDFWISVNYLGDQIEDYFKNGEERGVKIEYIWEDRPLGTIGAVSKITNFRHEYVLVTNSDILTNINYEDFFLDFMNEGADISIVTIPYNVDVPYAVLETNDKRITSFREKPTYTYYSNGGIYLMKKELLDLVPDDEFYNSTDLMQKAIDKGLKIISYPMRQYWLDIGKHEDYKKAQEDIKHIKF